MRQLGFLCFISLLLLGPTKTLAAPAYITFPSGLDLKTRHSAHFHVLYQKGQEDLAERTLRSAEKAYKDLVPIFPEGPEKTWIVLGTWQDATNGYALNLPLPHIAVFPSPPTPTSALASFDDWLDSLIFHEYVHILHLYSARGLWGVMRSLFGSWVLPMGILPGHFHEGMATFLETEYRGGGRGTAPHFKMIRRMAVAEKKWGTDEFLVRDRMDGTLSVWPHGASRYFFGYYLHRQLWAEKGKEGFFKLTESYSSHWPIFYGGPLDEVYGTNYVDLWRKIFDSNQVEAEKEIDSIKERSLSELAYLTEDRSGKKDLVLSPDGKKLLYRSLNRKFRPHLHIMEIKTKKILKKIDMRQASTEGMCWGKNKGGESLLVIKPESDAGHQDFSLSYYRMDPERFERLKISGKPSKHIRSVGCDKTLRRLLIYEEYAGVGWVKKLQVKFTKKGPRAKVIAKWKLPRGTWVPTSARVKSTWFFGLRRGKNTEIYRWEKKKKPKKVLTAGAHLTHLTAGEKLGTLLAIGDFDGRQEIWELHPLTKSMKKQAAFLGGVRAFVPQKDSFYVLNYRHGGYDVAKASRLRSQPIPIPAHEYNEPAIEPLKISEERSYTPWSTLWPRMWMPNILIVPGGIQFGALIPGYDIAQRNVYSLFGGYDTRGQPFASFSYLYRFAKTWGLVVSSFYSPTYIQSQRQFYSTWGGSIGVQGQLDFLDATWSLTPVYRQVSASVIGPERENVGVRGSLSKSMGYKSIPYAPSPIRGTTISLSHAIYLQALGSSDSYFSSTAAITQYLQAPWARTHVWYLKLQAGYTEGTTLNNSFFEGGGEILFAQRRGRFLNRGFAPGIFFGTEMATLNVEYRFPIAYIERAPGYFPVFLKRIHMALIGDVLTFGRASSSINRNLFDKLYGSVGLELKSNWQLFWYLPVQFRIGAYHGFGSAGENLYINFGMLASLL